MLKEIPPKPDGWYTWEKTLRMEVLYIGFMKIMFVQIVWQHQMTLVVKTYNLATFAMLILLTLAQIVM